MARLVTSQSTSMMNQNHSQCEQSRNIWNIFFKNVTYLFQTKMKYKQKQEHKPEKEQ